MQQPAGFGSRQHDNCVGRTGGAQVGALQRIDGDVHARVLHARRSRRAHLLADIQHGRLIAFAFADHDGARHLHAFKRVAHGLHGGLVSGFRVALAHGASRGDGGFLHDMYKIAQQIAFHPPDADWHVSVRSSRVATLRTWNLNLSKLQSKNVSCRGWFGRL